MPLIRGHHSFDDQFTQIPNAWLRDTRLSLKSIGLLAQIMSHTPGWNMSIRALARANGNGQDTIKTAILDLEKHGYLVRSEKQTQNADGTFSDYEFVTHDPFQNPVTVKPRHGEMGHIEEQEPKEEQETKNNERTNAHLEIQKRFDEFWHAYPRKDGKEPASRSFIKALKKTTAENLLIQLELYKNHNIQNSIIFAHASTWLNNERWLDENASQPSADSEALRRSQERRERDKRASNEYLAQLKMQESQRGLASRCEHDKIVAMCVICSKKLNE
jgi:hypothetical protein